MDGQNDLKSTPQYSLPVKPSVVETPEDKKKDADLQRQLDAHPKSWDELYGGHNAGPADGLSLKFGGKSLPLSDAGIDIWDLRDQPNSSSGVHNFGERYEPRGKSFGFSWHKSF